MKKYIISTFIAISFVGSIIVFANEVNQDEKKVKVLVSNVVFGEGDLVRVSNVPLKIEAETGDTEPMHYEPKGNKVYLYVPLNYEVTIVSVKQTNK